MLKSLFLSGLGIVAIAACSDSPGPPNGTVGGACYPNASCNSGLTCLSMLCVDDSGAGGSQQQSGGSSSGGDFSGGGTDAGGTKASGGANAGGDANASGTSAGGSSAAGTSAGGSSAGGSSAGGSSAGGTSAGGTSAGGTSAGGTSAGGSSAAGSNAGGTSAAGTSAGGGGGGAAPDIHLIDDFGDCDSHIIEIDGRKGDWFDVSSVAQNFKVGTPPTLSWLDQTCGVFLTGSCSACSTAGIGVILAPGAYDLSKFSGIRVKYESTATLFVRVKATNGSSYTYATSGGIVPAGGETTATIPFASMTQDVGFQGFAKADEIHFTMSAADKTKGFGIGIHRLELVP